MTIIYPIKTCVVEVINKCNLACKHCYSSFTGVDSLPKEGMVKILSELSVLGCERITLSGGEPLLHKQIFDYAKMVKDYDIKAFLTTNGTLIKEHNIKKYSIFDMVQISIDGPEKIHDMIRGNHNYIKAINSIMLLKKHNITPSVMMTINKITYLHFDWMVQFCNQKDIPLGIEVMTPTGRGKDLGVISKKEYRLIIEKCISQGVHCNEPTAVLYDEKKKEIAQHIARPVGGCIMGTEGCVISPTMDVLPCARLRIPMGNLHKSNLSEIWESGRIFQQVREQKNYKGKCRICSYFNICRGCRANAYAINGDFLAEDPFCWIS